MGHILEEEAYRAATNARLRKRLRIVKQHMVKCNAEVLVLIEGVDPTTSSTVQARQSYTVDDIAVGFAHSPCVRFGGRGAEIDFSLFHDLIPDTGGVVRQTSFCAPRRRSADDPAI